MHHPSNETARASHQVSTMDDLIHFTLVSKKTGAECGSKNHQHHTTSLSFGISKALDVTMQCSREVEEEKEFWSLKH